MTLVFFTEARFIRINNDYYALDSSFSSKLFDRYLQYFENIVVCARAKEGLLKEVIPANKISNNNVSVHPLPYYVGFNQFLIKYLYFRKAVKSAVNMLKGEGHVFLCRVPGRIGATAISFLERENIKYGIEVVGDPYDVLSNGATSHPLSSLIRFFSHQSLRKIANSAPMALYVTREKLQERYPNNKFNIGVSDVDMPQEAFADKERIKDKPHGLIRLICVGTLEQMYKAPDIMLRALQIILKKRNNVHLTWVGDGIFKLKMMELAKDLDVQEHVTFIGKLASGNAVREQLDQSDLFIMPSRMEGLPRAMVEAMARGLPCIGTKLCGIQELLDESVLVPINDVDALALKIIEMIDSPKLRMEQSEKNLTKSYHYHQKNLRPMRDEFYLRLREINNITH